MMKLHTQFFNTLTSSFVITGIDLALEETTVESKGGQQYKNRFDGPFTVGDIFWILVPAIMGSKLRL